MPRNQKKKDTTPETYFTDAELAAMSPAQKLDRIAGFESEIASHKQAIKDYSGAQRDLIKEIEAKKQELLEAHRKSA